ncbi:unnamed protein product [Closterium sp. NIES-64]|nr:unnamed protein product [Closterium sp. NIES-64]
MANLGFFKEVMAEAVDRAKGAVVEKTQAAVGKAREMVGLEGGEGGKNASGKAGGKAAGKAVGKAREMVGLVDSSAEPSAPPPEPSILDELNQYCSLTLKQSILVFPSPIKFALTYSIGNLMAIGSTGFLIGFTRQLKMMFDPIRIGAAIVFVLSLVLTLVAALYVQDALLTLLCIVVQACSLIWYSLSYIPLRNYLLSHAPCPPHPPLLFLSRSPSLLLPDLVRYSLSYIPFAQSSAKRCMRMCYEAEF